MEMGMEMGLGSSTADQLARDGRTGQVDVDVDIVGHVT